MLDIQEIKGRTSAALEAYRPTLIAFAVAAASFIVAGVYFFTPALAQTSGGGGVMRALARGLAVAFGPAAMILALLAGTHALLHVVGRGLAFDRWRIGTSAALVLLVPCLFSLVDRSGGAAGGVVGLLARDAITFFFPPVFAVPLLVGATLFALVLSTDWLFHGLLRGEPRAAAAVEAPAPPRPRVEAPRLPVIGEEEEEEEWEEEEEEEEEEEAELEEEEDDVEEEEEEPADPAPEPAPVFKMPPRPRRRSTCSSGPSPSTSAGWSGRSSRTPRSSSARWPPSGSRRASSATRAAPSSRCTRSPCARGRSSPRS